MKIRTGHNVVISKKLSAGFHSHHENKVRDREILLLENNKIDKNTDKENSKLNIYREWLSITK